MKEFNEGNNIIFFSNFFEIIIHIADIIRCFYKAYKEYTDKIEKKPNFFFPIFYFNEFYLDDIGLVYNQNKIKIQQSLSLDVMQEEFKNYQLHDFELFKDDSNHDFDRYYSSLLFKILVHGLERFRTKQEKNLKKYKNETIKKKAEDLIQSIHLLENDISNFKYNTLVMLIESLSYFYLNNEYFIKVEKYVNVLIFNQNSKGSSILVSTDIYELHQYEKTDIERSKSSKIKLNNLQNCVKYHENIPSYYFKENNGIFCVKCLQYFIISNTPNNLKDIIKEENKKQLYDDNISYIAKLSVDFEKSKVDFPFKNIQVIEFKPID